MPELTLEVLDLEEEFSSLVTGFYWKCRMDNGATFYFWTARGDITRANARKLLLQIANGEYGEIYISSDITSLWRSRS